MAKANFLKWFLLLIKVTNWGQGGIFCWNQTENKIVTKSADSLRYFQTFCYFCWPFVTCTTLQVLLSRGAPRALIFQSSLFVLAFISSFVIQLTLFSWRREIAANFNALFDFEERHNRSYSNQRDWMSYLTEVILLLAIASTVNLALAYGGMIYIEPCIPCNLAYFFIPECHYFHSPSFSFVYRLPNYLIKVPLIVANVTMTRFLFSGFILDAAGIATLQCYYFRNMLRLLKRLMTGSRGHQTDRVQLFRQVQILEIIFNNFHRQPILFEFATMTLVLPLSLYALIKVQELNLAQQLFFIMAVVDCPVVILGDFGITAELHKTCRKLLSGLQGNVLIQQNGYLKRYVHSWPVLKTRFGPANYVDKMTPVKSLDLSLNATASLLLMK